MAKIEITPLNISGVKVPFNLLDNFLGQNIDYQHLIYPMDLATNPQYCHAIQFSIFDYEYPDIENAYNNLSGLFDQGVQQVQSTVSNMASASIPSFSGASVVGGVTSSVSNAINSLSLNGVKNAVSGAANYVSNVYKSDIGGGVNATLQQGKVVANKAPAELDTLYQNYGGFLTPSAYLNRTKKQLASISLYMPDSLNTEISSTYEDANLTETFKIAGYAANAYSDYKKGGEITSTPSNIIADDYKRGATGILAGKLGDDKGILSNALKRIPNPQVQLLYRGLNLRSFQFDFTFTPSSQKEADEIDQIIKTFQYYSLPQLTSGAGGQFFVPPQIFGIKFAFMGNDGIAGQILDVFKNSVTNLLGNQFTKMITGSNPSNDIRKAKDAKIFQINDCVLENISINYAPNGWASYTDGSPVQTTLSLTFKEMNLINKDSNGVDPRVVNNPYRNKIGDAYSKQMNDYNIDKFNADHPNNSYDFKNQL